MIFAVFGALFLVSCASKSVDPKISKPTADSKILVDPKPQADPKQIAKTRTIHQKNYENSYIKNAQKYENENDSYDFPKNSGFTPNFLCKNKRYDITISSHASFFDVIERIASECSFSVIFLDDVSNKIMRSKNIILNFRKQTLDYILRAGFDALDLNYDFDGGVLRVSRLKTMTFSVHHISTSRQGESATNVIFSQNSAQNDNENDSHSGSKITSLDKLDFWGELKQKISGIIFREHDVFLPKDPQIIVDKNASLITITALKSQLNRAKIYIQKLNEKLSKQVLIDVNLLMISHSNDNTSGISFGALNLAFQGALDPKNGTNPILTFGDNFKFGVNIFSHTTSISSIISFLKKYGSVRTLSNPKILSLNNQPALISVGNIIRYSQNVVFQTSNNNQTTQNTKEIFPSVFAGILLDITPTILGEEIMLKINPSITSTSSKTAYAESDLALNRPPNLSTNQISSIIKLQNGQKAVLGGLISKNRIISEEKLPFLGSIPGLSWLFSREENSIQTTEMVIIISATIVR